LPSDSDDDKENKSSGDEFSEDETRLRLETAAKRRKKRNSKNMNPLNHLIEASARCGATERQTVLLVNAWQKDFGVDLEENSDYALTKSKFHVAKDKSLKRLSSAKQQNTSGLIFDGKKYDTLTHETVDELFHRNVVKKLEHYIVADAERQSFVGEFVPKDGTGASIASEVNSRIRQMLN
jgi:hypothetical protein